MDGDKIRFRFEKIGALRLLSHHDLMRSLERMLRRANLPFKQTLGFHPTPRVVFALSLPLGVDALNEVVELELLTPHSSDDVLARLNHQSPEGLRFLSAKVVPLKATAFARRAIYRLPLPPGRSDEVAARAIGLLASEKVWVDRLRPNPRRVNIRQYIRGITVTPNAVELDFWVTDSGTARGDEMIKLLELSDVIADGAILVRADLEIHDELPPGTPTTGPDTPPTDRPETAPLEHVPACAGDEEDDATKSATWGGTPDGPVVE